VPGSKIVGKASSRKQTGAKKGMGVGERLGVGALSRHFSRCFSLTRFFAARPLFR